MMATDGYPVFLFLVELQEAGKPVLANTNTVQVNVPSAPWTDYPISLTYKVNPVELSKDRTRDCLVEIYDYYTTVLKPNACPE